ncbi:T9SS type A sorting domain-containing protein [Ferruginibacter profundus]
MKKIYFTVFAAILLMVKAFAQCPASISVTSTNVTTATCPSNGAFTINATAGTGATYQITAGPAGYPSASQSSSTFSALLPGTYTVKVACQANPAIFTTTTVTIPSTYVQVAANSVVTNVCGTNAPGGTITTTAAGSSTPFTYAYWQGDPAAPESSLTYGTSNTYTAPAFGTYNIRTKDACGVFVTQTVTVANPYPANLCIESIFLRNENLTCAELQDSIWSNFILNGNLQLSSLPAAGIDVDVYLNPGSCASPVQGTLVSTHHYDNTSWDRRIKIPVGVNLLYVVRTPCGASCTYCYTYDPANSAFLQNVSMRSNGCVAPGNPITYSITVNHNVFYTYPITWQIKNSSGVVVATFTANSDADLPHSFNGLPSDNYTSIATDACGNTASNIVTPSAGNLNELYITYTGSNTGCTSIEGRTTLSIYVEGVMANFMNAVATIIAPSPNLIGVTASDPTGYFTWLNVIPGATYYIKIDNGCGQSDTVTAVVPTNINAILVQHTNATVQQLCGGTGNIIVDAAYNGWGSFSYSITNSAGTVVGTGALPGGTYSNLPAGTYTITTTVNGCAPGVYTYSSQVTILPGGSGPSIIKKLGVVCENAVGTPLATGSAIFSFTGAQPLKVEYKLSSQPDINYVTFTNNSDGSETITGLAANTSYTIRITDACGNAVVTEISIGQLSPLSTTSSSQPCVGSTYTLSVPDMVDATYTWTKNGVTISTSREIIFTSFTAGDNGTYTCTVVIAGGCVTRTVTVTLNSAFCGQVLPIKLLAFTVQKIDNSAKINWSTEQESNSSYFNVERSADGSNWITIATIGAAGNSGQRIDYGVYDNTPLTGVNYYRLKMVDKDGRYIYSSIQTALFKTKYTVAVAPNPAKDFIHIYIAKTGSQVAAIQLLDAGGKLIYSTKSSQAHLQISTSGIGKGLYFVKVVDADNVTVIKVLVE